MPKYHLALDLYRKVRVEYAGQYGYTMYHTRFRFPFGKGEPFRNWKEAEEAARYYWTKQTGQASEIAVSRLSNTNTGFGHTVFVTESMFLSNFEFPLPACLAAAAILQTQGPSSG